jgi:hypothetical protein
MKTQRIAVVLLTVLALLAMALPVGAEPPASKNFVAHLTGAGEFPARDTLAQGVAIFHVNDDGSLDFRLIAANINNVTAAHIHCGVPGANGPVGVNLYIGGLPGSGPFDGVLAAGSLTAPNAGNPCGWATMADVVADMLAGLTYVNVHTNDGVAPTNTGPGDFPGGEIRGQVEELGPSW